MKKVIHSDSQDQLVAAVAGQMWQLYEDRLIKSAASDTFDKSALQEHAPDKDHFMLHLVAMGAQERYGFNKNADGFPKQALEKYHPTFVSDGAFFREHRNRSQEHQGIGHVKASAYNSDLDRVELLVWGHKKKAAEEYEKARAGEPLSFSMSCRVPYDICNCCEKKASSPRDYCSHMKDTPTQYVPEFQKYAFVINDKPTFFDISAVAKPADRIAHYISYAFPDGDEHEKLASAWDQTPVIFGADWAEYEGLCIPDSSSPWPLDRQHIIEKLAAEELVVTDTRAQYPASAEKRAFIRDVLPFAFGAKDSITDRHIDTLRDLQPGTFFNKLASAGVLLPMRVFASYVTGDSFQTIDSTPLVKRAAQLSVGIFNKILKTGVPDELMHVFDMSSTKAASYDQAVKAESDAAMNLLIERFSVLSTHMRSNTIKRAAEGELSERERFTPGTTGLYLPPPQEKQAEALALAYGAYKVAAMLGMEQIHGNTIQEPQYVLSAGQNQFI